MLLGETEIISVGSAPLEAETSDVTSKFAAFPKRHDVNGLA